MYFDITSHFKTYNFVPIEVYPNFNVGLKYGFIFFFTAMLLGIGFNYAYRLLKV